MKKNIKSLRLLCLAFSQLACISVLFGQGTLADYQRANDFRRKVTQSVKHVPLGIRWNKEGDLFWYEKEGNTGREYVLVDTHSKTKETWFTVKELLDELAKELGKPVDSYFLASAQLKIIDKERIGFQFEDFHWEWNRSKKQLTKLNAKEKPENNNYYWGRRWDDSQGSPVDSPDGRMTAYIKTNNLYISEKDRPETERQLTFDGQPDHYYSAHIRWSPDGNKFFSAKVKKAKVRQLTLIESSPKDQLQPKIHLRDYAKPGDTLTQTLPLIYHVKNSKLYVVNEVMVDNQFAIYALDWRSDSRAISFEYNKRGHQQYAIVELDAETGKSRYVIDERNKTFIDYSGKKFRYDLDDGQQVIWASERDGWNHLYLFDGKTGMPIRQITKGNWPLRKVLHVDEKAKQIIFEASGRYENEDPYFIRYYSIGFDGNNLKELTPEKANHQGTFNQDFTLFVDLYSKVDQAPISVLRNRNGELIMELEKADIQELNLMGWKAPEVFTAKGRDGTTDIWGIIIRPTNFDSNKRYPVIEYIYAGPHSSFVPKSFYANPSGMQELAELGFIVVQIDGMGTSNRSKAFQDVAWKNIKDAGFPDRIAWMKAAAMKYSSMDLERVGIYGTSAGGQSSTGALLFHPEFYKVAVSSCGCHDNRMDKIWWNEQWMGWPIGPQYAESSNIEHAKNLKGNLMLIVGEMDDNVDPASTLQLSNALIKANKEHEMILIPGMGHSSGGEYGERKRRDFFVKHLLQVTPPAW